ACALGRPPPPSWVAVRCPPAGACFSAHRANASYNAARDACGRRRGGLAWLSGESELRLLLGLLAEAAVPVSALFWVGLKRNASTCTHMGDPLRGFTWEGAAGEGDPQEVPAALGQWVKEPMRSCLTVRCAGLHLLAGPASSPSWGWKE
ncbi:CLC14 protein, partial [Serilophus lunatus]|nr:CLC14 protein [Serilophus lunatus]